MTRRFPKKIDLPLFAAEYLDSHPSSRRVVVAFHVWLKRSYRPLLQLEPAELEPFLQSLGKSKYTKQTRTLDRRRALRYFDWLHNRDLLCFSAQLVSSRGNAVPSSAAAFIGSLKPTRKLSTVRGYETALRRFHLWLDRHQLSICDLDRSQIARWLQWLHERRYHPSTHVSAVLQIRAYLYWLEEQGDLQCPADALVRSSDLPRLPKYLPRPLPPELDHRLQRLLKLSDSPYALGLLLMRRTGLRIGELMTLAYSCIRTDAKGNKLLKVPLGKLNNERLVPLDKQTAKVAAKLRRVGRRCRTFLIESSPDKPAPRCRFTKVLAAVSRRLPTDEHITSHRLRHTYATSLLAGGMSLVGVMRLLGHRDFRMTLRYAAITDETLTNEYHKALEQSASRYQLPAPHPQRSKGDPVDPVDALNHVAQYIRSCASEGLVVSSQARALEKRLRRLQTALRKLPQRNPS